MGYTVGYNVVHSVLGRSLKNKQAHDVLVSTVDKGCEINTKQNDSEVTACPRVQTVAGKRRNVTERKIRDMEMYNNIEERRKNLMNKYNVRRSLLRSHPS